MNNSFKFGFVRYIEIIRNYIKTHSIIKWILLIQGNILFIFILMHALRAKYKYITYDMISNHNYKKMI